MGTNGNRLWTLLARARVDRLAALLGLVLGLLLVPLRLVLSTVYAEVFPVALVVACGLYLLALHTDREDGRPTLPGWTARLLPTLCLLGTAAMVLVAAFAHARPPLYHDVAVLVAGLVLAQPLLLSDDDLAPRLVLLQVVAFAVVLRGTALYTTPGYIGIDVWTHTAFVRDVLDAGTVAAIDGKYSMAPLYHLLVAEAASLSGATVRLALYATVGLVMPFAFLFVYGTAGQFVEARWALLAAALYSMADDVVEWSIHPIPTSMGLFCFLAGLYLLTRYLRGDDDWRTVALLVFVMLAVALTHQVSAFVFLVGILAGFVAQLLLGNRLLYPDVTTRSVLGLLAFDVGLLTLVWSLTPYRQGTFTQTMVGQIRRTIETDAGLFQLSGGAASAAGGGGRVSAVSPILEKVAQYVGVTGLVTLFAITVVGALYVLHHRRAEQATVALVGAIVAMLVYSLGLPILGINSFVPGRWIAFLYAPMAVVGVIGVAYLLHALPNRVVGALAVVLLLVYPTGMLLSSTATLDDPVFDRVTPKVAFSEEELAAMQTLGDHGVDGAPVAADSPYANVLRRSEGVDATIATVPRGGGSRNQVVLARPYQETGAPIFRRNGTTAIVRPSHDSLCGGRSQVYSDDGVAVCVA